MTPMKPSTGAAVRLHRNAVRDRPESLSAFKWNACPPSPEYPLIRIALYGRIESGVRHVPIPIQRNGADRFAVLPKSLLLHSECQFLIDVRKTRMLERHWAYA
jgi:hypothetical protein